MLLKNSTFKSSLAFYLKVYQHNISCFLDSHKKLFPRSASTFIHALLEQKVRIPGQNCTKQISNNKCKGGVHKLRQIFGGEGGFVKT